MSITSLLFFALLKLTKKSIINYNRIHIITIIVTHLFPYLSIQYNCINTYELLIISIATFVLNSILSVCKLSIAINIIIY